MADSDCKGNITFGVCIPSISCDYLMSIPYQDRCEFADMADDCHDDETTFHYTMFVTCLFNQFPSQIYLGLIPLFCFLVFYFITLSTISDYFTPSLCYVSNVLGLSESFAGATLLAFGNAAPDLVTSMVGAIKLGAEQIVAQVLGGGMFLTTVVMACIVLIGPFRLHPIFFIRNLFTYMVALMLLGFAYYDGTIYLYEAMIFFLLYASYIGLFFIQNIGVKKEVKERVMQILEEEEEAEDAFKLLHKGSLLSPISISPLWSFGSFSRNLSEGELSRSERPLVGTLQRRMSNRRSTAVRQLSEITEVELPPAAILRSHRTTNITGTASAVLEVERVQGLRIAGLEERALSFTLDKGNIVAVEIRGQRVVEKTSHLLMDFLIHMNPINKAEWQQSNPFFKACHVILVPIILACKLIIPCIDETVIINNWCKLLHMIQCLYLPAFIAWAMGIHMASMSIYLPVLLSLCIFGLVCSIFLALSSKVDEAPSYHIVIAVVGFFVSVLCIYLVAKEVVAILHTVGSVLTISMVTLSMTVLPWGNSVGDFVNAIALSRAGYSRMAYTGVYGSNLLMVLIGVGFSFLLMVTNSGSGGRYTLPIFYKGFIANGYFFLAVNCTCTMIIIPTMNFQASRCYGIFLVALYVMFFIFAMLSEFEVIVPLAM